MKILFVIHDFLPHHQAGAEICTYLLAKEMSKKHEVCLFFTEISPFGSSYKVTRRVFDNLPCIEIIRPMTTDLLGEPYNNKKMEDIFQTVLNDFKPDIVHLHHLLYHSLSYPEIAKRNNCIILFTLHDYWLTCPRWGQRLRSNMQICHTVELEECAVCLFEKPRETNIFSLTSFHYLLRKLITRTRSVEDRIHSLKTRTDLTHSAIKHVDLFIAPSPFLRREFIQFGIPKNKILLSDNGFNTSEYKKRKERNSSTIRFAFIGTINEHKGVHVLVEAFNAMPKERAELHIYGDSTWFPDYFAKLKDLSRSSAISFKGTVKNHLVADVLSEIDVLVVPSIWFENSPLTIHEAFMAGVPVITSNIGGMADLIDDGVNGLLFDVNNAQELFQCMMKLINSETLLKTLRKGIPQVKSVEENGLEMEQIYLQLLG